MSSTQSLVPVEKADLPALTDLVHSCKLALSINRLIIQDWPNESVQKRQYSGAVKDSFESSTIEDLKLVDDGTGEIVGYVVLRQDKAKGTGGGDGGAAPEKEPGHDPQGGVPEGLNPDLLKVVQEVSAKVDAATEDIDHLRVLYICVKQSRRRQGAASKMIKAAAEKAKAMGLPLVACSEPAAVPFYTACGFKETAHGDIDLAQFAMPMAGFGVFRLTGVILKTEE